MNASTTTAAILAAATTATAQNLPQVNGEMKHVFITLDDTGITAEIDSHLAGDPPSNPVSLLSYPDDDPYTAGSILDNTFYSARYGWLQNGFITLDEGQSIYITQLDATPGLNVYEGGMRMMRQHHTYAPLFGTGGSDDAWQWPVSMVHNWYSVNAPGNYQATYEVFVGDANGNPIPGLAADQVTLTFTAVPAPGAAGLVAAAAFAIARRRR